MTGMTMYDAIDDQAFPPGAAAYAAYVDGDLADQPNYSFIVREFPDADHLSITLFPDKDAGALDVENGAAQPSDIPGWYARQKAAGVARPCVYANTSTMQTAVLPVILAAGIARTAVRLWTAHYGVGEHICGPKSCRGLSVDADGTQWADDALGRDLDQSLLLDDFFGTPAPAPPTTDYVEFDMSKLPALKLGDSDKTGSFWSVRRLQALIALTGRLDGITPADIVDDGVFGKGTDAGVRAIQGHYKITVDGIAGAQTWGVLLTGTPG